MTENDSTIWELPRNDFHNCFGCSQNNQHGLKLRFWYIPDGCRSYYTIPSEYSGFSGIAHGGIIATMLDEVAAWTIIVHYLRPGITQNMSIRYLKPVKTCTEILIEGKIIENNEKSSKILSIISSKEGKVLAEAESNWLIPSYSTISKIMGVDKETIEEEMNKFILPLQEFLNKKREKK